MSVFTLEQHGTSGRWRPMNAEHPTLSIAINVAKAIKADGYGVRILRDGKVWASAPWQDSIEFAIEAATLADAAEELLEHAGAYSDKMREIGRGSAHLGACAGSETIGGMARAAISRLRKLIEAKN